jgi:hypothetical protein
MNEGRPIAWALNIKFSEWADRRLAALQRKATTVDSYRKDGQGELGKPPADSLVFGGDDCYLDGGATSGTRPRGRSSRGARNVLCSSFSSRGGVSRRGVVALPWSLEGGCGVRNFREPPTTDAGAEVIVEDEGIEEDKAPDYARFGQHLTSVLEAAGEAARGIEDEARADAERLLERTQQEAASTLVDTRRQAEEILADAERVLTEAENESKLRRERAETDAAEKLRDAEVQVANTLSRIDDAQSRAAAAEERAGELEANVELTETRLQELTSALFDAASRLASLIERHPRPVADATDAESASEPIRDESLDDALGATVKGSEPG